MPRTRFALMVLALAVPMSEAVAEGGIFIGSTPCAAPVRTFLGIGSSEKCELVRWELTLALDEKTSAPSRFVARVEYGLDGKRLKKLEREGSWTPGVGTREHPDAAVYKLTRGKATLAIWKITDDNLHLLTPKRNLLVGNDGYSYTLNRALADPDKPAGPIPEMSYKLLPLAAGATVYGVFEGRTPCALFRESHPTLQPGCQKLKWRLTLFQQGAMHALTNYRLEGGLFPSGARAGAVTVLPGTPFDANARVLRLEPATGEQPLLLMSGDDNVLFFLDDSAKPMLGNRDFSYTLNRRSGS